MKQHRIKQIIINLLMVVMILLCMLSFSVAQNLDYDFESWQGKENLTKFNMQIPLEFIEKNKMKLISGSNSYKFFYIMGNDQKDSPANLIQVGVFQNSLEAQLRLFNYLNDLTSPIKLTELSEEYSINADIAFGNIQSDTSFLVFTKNNVFIMIRASSKIAQEIASTFTKIINDSPYWKEGDIIPGFILRNN